MVIDVGMNMGVASLTHLLIQLLINFDDVYVKQSYYNSFSSRPSPTLLDQREIFEEGPEGVNWELELAFFEGWQLGFFIFGIFLLRLE